MRLFSYFATVIAAAVIFSGCKKETQTINITPEMISAFAEAAYNGTVEAVAQFLQNGMPVDQTEENGNTALMLAAFNGHIETMKKLIDAGAIIDLRDSNGRTALMFASTGPYPSAVKLLLEHGADVNAADVVEKWTPVMFAAGEGLSPVVDILLQHGADPKMKDKDDDTAADFARGRGFIQLADKLQKLIDK